nr:gustatory receptor 16 [Papilio dardanus]
MAVSSRINTYLNQFNKSSIDLISQIYGMISWLLGIHRLLILFKLGNKCKILTLAYSLIFNIIICYFVFKSNTINSYMKFLNVTEYFLCAIIAVIYNETLLKFYNGIFHFDKEIKSKWLVTSESVINCLQAIFNLILVIILNVWRKHLEHLNNVTVELIPAHLSHVCELHYYCHLFGFIKLRLKSIRILLLTSFPINDINCFESSLINYKEKYIVTLVKNNKKVSVRKLLDLYSKVIAIYDFLNSALQWQLLLILSTTFLVLLIRAYNAALHLINYKYTIMEGLFDVAIFSAVVGPIVTVCGFGQRIHDEVMLLQTALYSRIYKNSFDKKNRSIASSLLALTEVRTLSFSVFRMFDLNISFPFKFFGLIASYLVILLQFNKVTSFE